MAMPKKLADLPPELQAEADRILALPTGARAEANIAVATLHAFLDAHGIENVSMFTDDFGSAFLKDQDGKISPCLREMPR